MKAICEESERQHEAEAVAATECAQLRAELTNLRAELEQRRRADFETIVEVVAGRSNDVLDQVEALTNRMLAELFDKLDNMFAALQARLDAVLLDTKRALRCAREQDEEVSELPNPPPPGRAIN